MMKLSDLNALADAGLPFHLEARPGKIGTIIVGSW
jgi:hypothetical protein